ncbi:YihY/virulence factor BrkB family protein [Schumannella soli]|uniref:YihY/virulence factor BrkB family protein n=1 Tax=Schumannella soli TaxID=2590779 RepID=A0A506Y3A5_9MICO|nr:YihY/virulence factor BrkB family protein [Schumannella soli]TPW76070.1 YihY/virulence factor BrkB family protein [Schumannella soli]
MPETTPVSRRRRTVYALRRTWRGYLRGRGYDAAAALTFFAVLTAFPATLLTVAAFALRGAEKGAASELVALLGPFVPAGETDTVRDAIGELLSLRSPGIAVLIGLALTLWTASGWCTAYGRAVNTICGVQEGRPFWYFRGWMLVIAAAAIVLGGAALGILLVGPDTIGELVGGPLSPVTSTVWAIVRWPLLLVLLVALLALLQRHAPNVRVSGLRRLSLGSLLTLTAWAAVTGGFALYLHLIGAYGQLYGRLGILLAGVLWAYLSSTALVLGAQLDVELIRLQQLDQGVEAEDHIRLPVKRTDRMLQLARQHDQDVAEGRRMREELSRSAASRSSD